MKDCTVTIMRINCSIVVKCVPCKEEERGPRENISFYLIH